MAKYGTKLTTVGIAKLANAQVSSSKVQITHIAVGDGNGVAYTPTGAETALKREQWRGTVNKAELGEGNTIIVEGIVPATAGGFTMREVGLYDADGAMIAIGNYPDTEKTTVASGVAGELILRTVIKVANTSAVDLKINTDLVTATKSDIDVISEQLAHIVVNGNEFTDLQSAINYCIANGKTLNIAGMTFNLTTGLIIDGSLKIVGDVSSTVLNFNAVPGGAAITVSDEKAISGLVFDGVKLVGNPNLTALKINGTIVKPITDSSFKNMRIQNFGIGLEGVYSWCLLFENVRWQGCVKPLSVGSQFNCVDFNRCSFASYSQASTLTNCEGINFNSPNIANVTSNAFRLFQSNVSIVNPYYEYIDGYAFTIGGSNEGAPSTLIIAGGKTTDANVRIRLDGERVRVKAEGLGGVGDYVITNNSEIATVETKFSPYLDIQSKNPVFLSVYDGASELSPFQNAFNSNRRRLTLTRNKTAILTNSTENSDGIKIANNLVVGEIYTLIYVLKKVGSATASIHVPNKSSSLLNISEATDDFELRYMPFTATDSIMRLQIPASASIEISYLALAKGSVFPKVDLNKKGDLIGYNAPASSTWSQGDRVYNIAPIANGNEGWVCTVAGTPGTWKTFGIIQA